MAVMKREGVIKTRDSIKSFQLVKIINPISQEDVDFSCGVNYVHLSK